MRLLFLAAALVAASISGMAMAEPETRQITVTGQGQVETEPDMAVITLGVTNQSREAAQAMAATSEAVADVLARLAAAGIAERDVQTRSLSLNPVWSNRGSSGSGKSEITGYVAGNAVMVRVRDLSRLGQILDASVSSGANDFNGLSFSVQDPEPMLKIARKRAVEDAMSKAVQLADAAGIKLGRVMSMSEQGGGGPRPMARQMAAAESVPIAAGEVSLATTVTMVFEIAQ